MDIPINVIRLIGMALFLGLSFFFSGSETALFSLSKEDLHRFRERGGRLGALICSLRETPRDLLIAILFGNMVVNVFFFSLSFAVLSQIQDAVVQTIIGVASLVLVIICGEVAPKALAVTRPMRFARVVAIPIAVWKKVTFPIRIVLGALISLFSGIGGHRPEAEKYITTDELKMLVGLSQQAGTINRRERTMINEVVEFGEIRVKEVLTPRVDMTMFELPGGMEEFRELVRRTRHSKVPVYRGDIDNVVGVIHSKDAFLHPDADLETLVRPIQFVPESKTVESLLKQFREQKTQLAMVVDEYGGFEGMVTIEDILEEIVGEIEDEFDTGEESVQKTDDGAYLLSGDLSMREWAEMFGDDLMLPGVNTLGGFVTALLGHVPHEREEIRYKNLFFTIKKTRRRRVAQVLLQLEPKRVENKGESES